MCSGETDWYQYEKDDESTGKGTHIRLGLLVDQQTSAALIEDAVEHLVEDHLRESAIEQRRGNASVNIEHATMRERYGKSKLQRRPRHP